MMPSVDELRAAMDAIDPRAWPELGPMGANTTEATRIVQEFGEFVADHGGFPSGADPRILPLPKHRILAALVAGTLLSSSDPGREICRAGLVLLARFQEGSQGSTDGEDIIEKVMKAHARADIESMIRLLEQEQVGSRAEMAETKLMERLMAAAERVRRAATMDTVNQ